jgi:sulfite reductase (ferredoxin)
MEFSVTEENKPSKAEKIKEDSDYLRGNIIKELSDDNPYFSNESYELLKFHGSYQGYNRDTATARKKDGLDKEWEFMLRMTCPGGKLTAKQYLALDEIADKYANKTLRITTRETFQFHCIVKENLKKHIAAINEQLLSTLGGCGDVSRNVVCVNAPINDVRYQRMMQDAKDVAKFLTPQTTSYHEIWMDGENITPKNDVEPLYGKHYMPRKFKVGFAIPQDNSIDVLSNDLAFILIYDGDVLKGYNVCLGGGMGITHNKASTYPRFATPIAFVEADQLLKATEAVVKLQRDNGDRSNRKHARLKYVVEEKGIEWTRSTLEEYFGSKMQDPVEIPPMQIVDHMGWHEQKDGKYYLGLPISSGRIIDRESEFIKTGIREVLSNFDIEVRLTADQNIIFCDIEEYQKDQIEQILRKNGVKLVNEISRIYRNTIACVALPTCGKALAEAERIKLPLIAEFEQLLAIHDISNEEMAFTISGCPNGCPRPYSGDLSIVGRTPGHYAMYIGGDFERTRLNCKILDKVPYENLMEVFDVILKDFIQNRQPNEKLGNYANRVGTENIASLVQNELGDMYKWAVAS